MLHCTQCGRAIQDAELGATALRCVGCGARHEARLFPALLRGGRQGSHAELLGDDSDAACFEHAGKKAVAACSSCGRFLCGLCEVEMGGEVLCFECFAEQAREGGGGELESRAVLYDSIALSLAVLPILFWPLTLISAPLALFVAIRYWKRPGGLVPRTRVRFVVAAVLALLQIAGWIFLAGGIIAAMRTSA